MEDIIVATSGFFNPLHIGHINYLREAKNLGTYLVVIVNNDKQVKLKGNVLFMNEKERMEIIKALYMVNEVILSIDEDSTVCQTLKKVRPEIFANGGDVDTIDKVLEWNTCQKIGCKVIAGIGGEKVQSSSSLLKGLYPCGNDDNNTI